LSQKKLQLEPSLVAFLHKEGLESLSNGLLGLKIVNLQRFRGLWTKTPGQEVLMKMVDEHDLFRADVFRCMLQEEDIAQNLERAGNALETNTKWQEVIQQKKVNNLKTSFSLASSKWKNINYDDHNNTIIASLHLPRDCAVIDCACGHRCTPSPQLSKKRRGEGPIHT
jgi:hypothetical protein